MCLTRYIILCLLAFSVSQTAVCTPNDLEEHDDIAADIESIRKTEQSLDSTIHTPQKKNFWDRGFGRFLKKIDKWMEDGMTAGIDTIYQCAPDLKSYCYLGGYTYWNNYQMHLPFNFPNDTKETIPALTDGSYYDINAHTTQIDLEVGIDYKGLTLFIPIPIRNNFTRSFGLAKNGSSWGFRVRYKEMRHMRGYRTFAFSDDMSKFVQDNLDVIDNGTEIIDWLQDKSIDPNNNVVRTFFAEAYYVLNNKKFSLSAGLFGDMVQKKSAGGIIIYANYYQTRYSAEDLLIADFDSFRTQQVSVGCGYGYNFSLLHGKVVFHLSAIPMFTLYSHLVHKARYTNEKDKEEIESMYAPGEPRFYDAADNARSHFRINAFGRFSATYSFNRYLLTFLLNYRHYGYSNSKNLKIRSQEADAQLNFCVRF